MILNAELVTGLMGSTYDTKSRLLRYKGRVVGYAPLSMYEEVGNWIYKVNATRDLGLDSFNDIIQDKAGRSLVISHDVVDRINDELAYDMRQLAF